MPPKQTFTKDKIVDAALTLMRREGFDKLTARGIAKELGSSTMPVYSTIESMEKLKELIFVRSTEIAAGFREQYKSSDVLVNYALGHIMLAKEESALFHLVWMDNSWDLSLINKNLSKNIAGIKQELMDEGKYVVSADDEQFLSFLRLAWLLVRGIAVEVHLGTFNTIKDDENFVREMTAFLKETFDDLFGSHKK